MKVALRVQRVGCIEAARLAFSSALIVDVEMTSNQCKDAILDLINHDGEQAVCEWFKECFPEWFEVTA